MSSKKFDTPCANGTGCGYKNPFLFVKKKKKDAIYLNSW